MKEYAFEKLEVWQISRSLLKNIYDIPAKFPSEERYGFSGQLRRAGLSVSSNIAEGSTRRGSKDQARFYEIAFGSLIEVLNQLILASDLDYISERQLGELRGQIDQIGRMLHSLRSATK